MPVALATSTAATTLSTRSVSSLLITTAFLSRFNGQESLIGVLVAQCVALLIGPRTKLNYGLKTKNTTA